jgi:hypothetical protein
MKYIDTKYIAIIGGQLTEVAQGSEDFELEVTLDGDDLTVVSIIDQQLEELLYSEQYYTYQLIYDNLTSSEWTDDFGQDISDYTVLMNELGVLLGT